MQALLFSAGVIVCGMKGNTSAIGLLNLAFSTAFWHITLPPNPEVSCPTSAYLNSASRLHLLPPCRHSPCLHAGAEHGPHGGSGDAGGSRLHLTEPGRRADVGVAALHHPLHGQYRPPGARPPRPSPAGRAAAARSEASIWGGHWTASEDRSCRSTQSENNLSWKYMHRRPSAVT